MQNQRHRFTPAPSPMQVEDYRALCREREKRESRSRIDFYTHPPNAFDLEVFALEHRDDLNAVFLAEERAALLRQRDDLWGRVRAYEERDEIDVEL